jgi:hypothetical protein
MTSTVLLLAGFAVVIGLLVFGFIPWRRWRCWHLLLTAVFFAMPVTVVVGAWAVVFYKGYTHWDKDELQLRGTFGDSFGVLGAIFSGAAFIGAVIAVYLQWRQLAEQRAEIGRSAVTAKEESVETRFFQLLASFQNAVNAVRVGDTYQGRQAIRKIADWLTVVQIHKRANREAPAETPRAERRHDLNQWYIAFYEGEKKADGPGYEHEPAGDLLGHLFRIIYHIVKYLDENVDINAKQKRFYIRILRAHLSNPELLLLFYNGLSKNGYDAFFPLIEKYDLLQNFNVESLPVRLDALLYERLKHLVQPAPAV